MELCKSIKVSNRVLYDLYSDAIYFINEEMKCFLEYSIEFSLKQAMKKWEVNENHEVIHYLLSKGLIINTEEYQKRCILSNVACQGSTFFGVENTNLNKYIMESGSRNSIGFIGIPFNRGSVYNNISIESPNYLRKLSNHLFNVDNLMRNITYYSTFLNKEVEIYKDIYDFGDLDISFSTENFCYTLSQISNYVSKSNIKPIYIGGDHSITEYIVKGISENFSSLNVLHIDAHSDLTPSQSNHPNHSSVVYRISQNKEVNNIYMMGISGFLHKEEYDEIKENPKVHWINHPNDINSSDPLYITIDVDVFDSSFVDSVSYPNYNGWKPTEFIENMINVLEHNKVIGLDVVEYDSNKDLNRKSGTIINSLILELQQYL